MRASSESKYRVCSKKCGGQEDVIHAGSWSRHRRKWVGDCWGQAIQ